MVVFECRDGDRIELHVHEAGQRFVVVKSNGQALTVDMTIAQGLTFVKHIQRRANATDASYERAHGQKHVMDGRRDEV